MNKHILENLPKGIKESLLVDINRELTELSGDGYASERLSKRLNRMGVANKKLYTQADLLEIREYIV